ncbi:unnamed protein product, partial [Tilletia controversa]
MDHSHNSGRTNRGGRPPSAASHTSERAPHPTISTTPATRPTTADPNALSIIAEVRYMRDGLEARLDGFGERLGAMERWQRGQELAEDERDVNTTPAAAEEQPEPESDSEEIGITNFGMQTPAFVNTRRRDRAPPPHQRIQQSDSQPTPTSRTTVAAQELRASSFVTSTPGGLSPRDRFRLLDGQNRRKVRRTMKKLGLEVPEFMNTPEGASNADHEDDFANSSESPLRSRDTANQDGALHPGVSPSGNTTIAVVPSTDIACASMDSARLSLSDAAFSFSF